MKLPKIFIPDKNLEKNIEEMLKAEKVLKHREIEDVFSLLNLPEDIGGYHTDNKRIDNKRIPPYAWCKHFGSLFSLYLVEAGIMYFEDISNSHCTIYSLNFSSRSELDEVIRRTIGINREFIGYRYGRWVTKHLRKDNYMVSIFLNKEKENDLSFFKDWYVDNFGMAEI